MKKVALLCVVALCLAACHCERRTTGTPCRKAACQCARGNHQACMHQHGKNCQCAQCKAHKHGKDCKCPKCKAAHAHQANADKPVAKAPVAPAKTLETKTAEQSAALSNLGTVNKQGNVISLAYKEPIRFGHNSDVIENVSYKEINATAAVLKKYPNNKIIVKGYTDSLGNPAYNVDLSQRRAQAVADALVARGVNANNISAVGLGAANPVATNSTAAGRAQNRRVELEVSVK